MSWKVQDGKYSTVLKQSESMDVRQSEFKGAKEDFTDWVNW